MAAVNDAPVLSLPTGQVTDEDTSISFSADNANAITISDVDEGEQAGVDETLHVTLTATDGLISLGGTTDLTFDEDAGDGTDDASMAFSGTIAAVNTALDGLDFSPDDDFNGEGASIRLQVSDLGYNGAGERPGQRPDPGHQRDPGQRSARLHQCRHCGHHRRPEWHRRL